MSPALLTLQRSLDKLVRWANDWQLSINIQKCSVLSVSAKHAATQFDYSINGVFVPPQDSTTDLVVTISNNLSFEAHINNIVSKARQCLSVLFRGFLTRNTCVMRQAFIAYIRPILDYNNIVWNPGQLYLIDLFEGVQRNFSKHIPSLSFRTPFERLALLNLESLELRRLIADLTYYYKILNNLTPFDPKEVLLIYAPLASSRSGSPYFSKPTKATNKTLSLLFYRWVDAWKALPVYLRLSPWLTAFKRGLNNTDLSSFLKGSLFSNFHP